MTDSYSTSVELKFTGSNRTRGNMCEYPLENMFIESIIENIQDKHILGGNSNCQTTPDKLIYCSFEDNFHSTCILYALGMFLLSRM